MAALRGGHVVSKWPVFSLERVIPANLLAGFFLIMELFAWPKVSRRWAKSFRKYWMKRLFRRSDLCNIQWDLSLTFLAHTSSSWRVELSSQAFEL
jgi:hypothetical protein